MIKLATVFSGIGAIEHALKRMNIDYKIVFACDNGDVNILSKDIDVDTICIKKEIVSLKQITNRIKAITNEDINNIEELKKILEKIENEFTISLESLLNFDEQIYSTVKEVLTGVVNDKNVKKSRIKEYKLFLSNIDNRVDLDLNFILIKCSLKILSDFLKDNSIEQLQENDTDSKFSSVDNINWNSYNTQIKLLNNFAEELSFKKIIKEFKSIAERLEMLHERINSLHISKELESINNYADKKKYVDNLYKDNESQNKVKQSYFANYDISEDDFHWNVSFIDGRQYRDKVDLFVGGSPCQSFSLVGKQRGLEDTRGTLFYEYARLVNEIKPKVFIYENVKAVLSNDNGRTWDTMKKVFTDLDYTWYQDVLNAKDYGIPQNRERIFVVGFRNDLVLKNEFMFPTLKNLEKTMQDFLLDNVSGKYYLPKKGVEFVTSEKNLTKRYTQIDGDVQLCQKKNQQFNWHGDFVFVEENKDMEKTMHDLEKYFLSEKVKKYVLSTGTKGFYSKPQIDLKVARPLLTTMHKMHRAGVDNYVTTEGRLRKLTPRECLRLMGFCDSFKIVVSDTSMYQQAGNSIVVDVLIELMYKIIYSYPDLIKEE